MKAADTHLTTPFGTFILRRYPARRVEPLQAWCAADSLLLQAAAQTGTEGHCILAVNDSHGALCVALQPRALWTDSALSARAVRANQVANGQTPTPVLWSTEPPGTIPGLVVLRVAKQLPYFQYQLALLSQAMPAGSMLLAAGMDKHLSPHTATLLERYIGPTQRHRGERKARLFSAVRDHRPGIQYDAPASYFCAEVQAELTAQPNVFSRDGLDIGSRFLLQHLESLAPADTVIDLACGNGVLGLAAYRNKLARRLVFCDESAMSIDSARENAHRMFPDDHAAFSFYQGDGLLDYPGSAAQLILCNPPFHLDHTVDEFAGRRLLKQCAERLLPGGQLCLVANQHLQYLPVLKRHFPRVERIAANAKFNILLASKH